ncbi:beta-galactosidase [Solwaraspora sp. WMMD406]|uniref:beta-galactosidase n=1 Tax=Solwaraspora sp. WMMD406 TaxID=3016095 RepID=UPI0024159FBC|nr:beta-galactosidase [Solwaraspora sp. WMMD406]MDG4765233.1 beta-galactosidase [Solwaraspora sp. WMMD406]
MTRVRIARKSILIDDEPVYVRSGELPYYRTGPDSWRHRLDAARDANLNCVATYIPWEWHEPTEGAPDLTGATHPQRDLVRFLDLVADSGLRLMIRPGPFINSEFRYGGHPAWVFDNHPQVWSRDADGKPALWRGHGVPIPAQLHPDFLSLVDGWYEQVVPLLARYTIDNGGPIVLSQPDNEMNICFTYGLGHSLYDADSIGDGTTPGRWQRWLLDRYGSAEAVARRHGVPGGDLAALAPPRRPAADPAGRRRIADWLDYKTWYIFTFASHLVERFRALGLDVPFTMNEPVNMMFKGGDHAAASTFFRHEEGRYFTTGHLYLSGGEQDLIGVPTTLYRLELVKMLDLAGPTFVAELASGWVDLTRNRAHYNFDLLTRLALGHGLDGYNIYMFSGGYNPPGSNNYGRDYHWNAPVLPDGSRHPTFDRLARTGAWIDGWQRELVDTEKEIDFYLALSTDLAYQARWMDEVEVLSPGSEDTFGYATVATKASHDAYDGVDGVIRIMTEFNAHFTFVNPYHPPRRPITDRPVVVPTSGRLPRQGFDLLRRQLDAGQTVVFFPTVPTMDLDSEPATEFLRFAGLDQLTETEVPIPGMEPGRTRFLTIDGTGEGDAGMPEVAVDRGLRTFAGIGDDAEVLATHEGRPVIFRRPAGRGQVLVMGVYPSYLTRDSQDFFRTVLLDAAGVRRRVTTTGERLHAVLRHRPDSPAKLVTVANVAGGDGTGRVTVALDGEAPVTFPHVGELAVDAKSVYQLWLDLDLGYTRMVYATTELTPTNTERTAFTARGDRLAPVELAFDRPTSGSWNGAPFHTEPVDEVHVVSLRHHDGTAELRLDT